MDAPLVSCIMPTADRPYFITRSIKMFLAQSYINKELIILDDGDSPIKDLVPDHERIRYFLLPKMNIGEKRNALCAMAHGDIIIHWDDDDFHAYWRVDTQVKALQKSGAPVTGLNNFYCIDESNGNGWMYTWPEGRGPWVHGATMAYTKDCWKRLQFANVPNAEDLLFTFSVMAGPIPPYITHYNRWFVGSRHKANTSGPFTGGSNWSKIELPTWLNEFTEREHIYGEQTENL